MVGGNLGLAEVRGDYILVLTVFHLTRNIYIHHVNVLANQPMELYIKKTDVCFGNKIKRRC